MGSELTVDSLPGTKERVDTERSFRRRLSRYHVKIRFEVGKMFGRLKEVGGSGVHMQER